MDYRKLNFILMRVTAVLLVLVTLSTGMVSKRYARYVTTATYESGARIARFNIVETRYDLVNRIELKLEPGQTTVEAISVKNYSEVAVDFHIQVENTYKNLPVVFTLSLLENEDESTLAEGKEINAEVQIGAGQDTKELKLRVDWPAEDNSLAYVGKADMICITVNAVQAD